MTKPVGRVGLGSMGMVGVVVGVVSFLGRGVQVLGQWWRVMASQVRRGHW